MLRFWMIFAAVVLIASFTTHASTFFGIDPIESIPGVMFIHALIFPPFIAALHYASKHKSAQQEIFDYAPRWLRLVMKGCFVYAMINFVIFFFLIGNGHPKKRGDKYFRMRGSQIVREIDQREFHRQQAHIVRGFSGHWMLFSSAALAIIVGVSNVRTEDEIDAKEAIFGKKPPSTPPAPASSHLLSPRTLHSARSPS